jgi:hypothetical protein
MQHAGRKVRAASVHRSDESAAAFLRLSASFRLPWHFHPMRSHHLEHIVCGSCSELAHSFRQSVLPGRLFTNRCAGRFFGPAMLDVPLYMLAPRPEIDVAAYVRSLCLLTVCQARIAIFPIGMLIALFK